MGYFIFLILILMATTKKIVKKPTKQITKTDDLFQRHEKDT
jgi:hypothetical protein